MMIDNIPVQHKEGNIVQCKAVTDLDNLTSETFNSATPDEWKNPVSREEHVIHDVCTMVNYTLFPSSYYSNLSFKSCVGQASRH